MTDLLPIGHKKSITVLLDQASIALISLSDDKGDYHLYVPHNLSVIPNHVRVISSTRGILRDGLHYDLSVTSSNLEIKFFNPDLEQVTIYCCAGDKLHNIGLI